jgi:pilus assembly protein FimV
MTVSVGADALFLLCRWHSFYANGIVAAAPARPGGALPPTEARIIRLAATGLVLALAASAAAAAELGRLTVHSGVGEALRAEIDILDVRANETRALAARLGTADEFWRAGIEPPAVLGALRAAVARGAKGRVVVTVTSSEPIEEPFISLLVQLDSPSRQTLREYPVLLEERRTREARPAPGLPGLPPALPSESAPGEPGAAPVGPTAVAAAEGGHRVQPGETLATIANAYKVPGATLDQVLAALYRANPGAFLDGNMNQLPAGRVLAIPDEAAVRAVAPDEARRLVADHRGAAQAASDRLRLSRADHAPRGGAADDVAAMHLAAKEAQERIVALEKNIESLQRLAELQNRQIARLQHAAVANAAPPAPGDAAAADLGFTPPRSDARYVQRAFARLADEYWAWLATAAVLAFAAWVWMPLKTARLWRKKRRRKARMLERIVRGEDRARRRKRRSARGTALAPA